MKSQQRRPPLAASHIRSAACKCPGGSSIFRARCCEVRPRDRSRTHTHAWRLRVEALSFKQSLLSPVAGPAPEWNSLCSFSSLKRLKPNPLLLLCQGLCSALPCLVGRASALSAVNSQRWWPAPPWAGNVPDPRGRGRRWAALRAWRTEGGRGAKAAEAARPLAAVGRKRSRGNRAFYYRGC